MTDFFELQRLAGELELAGLLTILSILPLLVVTLTTFTRNVIVLSILRHALGLQQSPPNIIIILLAFLLMVFSMQTIFMSSYDQGVKPYLAEELEAKDALVSAWQPLRDFMISQTQESDITFFYEHSNAAIPDNPSDVQATVLLPAFLVSELKLAFKMGFIIFLPFLLVDVVIAAILTSMGMIMVPPITISLPLKIMLFVLIDGWSLISEVLLRSAMT